MVSFQAPTVSSGALRAPARLVSVLGSLGAMSCQRRRHARIAGLAGIGRNEAPGRFKVIAHDDSDIVKVTANNATRQRKRSPRSRAGQPAFPDARGPGTDEIVGVPTTWRASDAPQGRHRKCDDPLRSSNSRLGVDRLHAQRRGHASAACCDTPLRY